MRLVGDCTKAHIWDTRVCYLCKVKELERENAELRKKLEELKGEQTHG